MTDDPPIGGASQDAYLRWRQRLADKQAERRGRTEPPPVTSRGQWDPETLFLTDAPPQQRTPQAPAEEQVVDLRAIERTPARAGRPDAPAGASPAVHRPEPRPEPEPTRGDPTVDAGSAAGRLDLRRARYESVRARLAGSTTRSVPDAQPIADVLRDLNRRRLEGVITEAEFKAQKAELFRR